MANIDWTIYFLPLLACFAVSCGIPFVLPWYSWVGVGYLSLGFAGMVAKG